LKKKYDADEVPSIPEKEPAVSPEKPVASPPPKQEEHQPEAQEAEVEPESEPEAQAEKMNGNASEEEEEVAEQGQQNGLASANGYVRDEDAKEDREVSKDTVVPAGRNDSFFQFVLRQTTRNQARLMDLFASSQTCPIVTYAFEQSKLLLDKEQQQRVWKELLSRFD